MQVKKKRNLIFANVFLLLVLAAGATYAWFALNTTANVTINNVQIVGPGELQMTLKPSPEENDWSPYLTISETDTMFKDLKMIDVSGVGDGKFYRPKSVGNDGEPSNNAEWINVSDAQEGDNLTANHNGANRDYIKINLKLRAKSDKDVVVSLQPGSKLDTVAATDKLKGENAENKSTFGNFSKDYVVGGMRVSTVTRSGDTAVRKFTWIPRTDVMLKVTAKPEGNVYELLTGAEIKDNDAAAAEVKKHKYISTASGNSSTKTELTGDTLITGPIDEETTGTELVTLSGKNYTGYRDGEVTLYIWLEGCDTEARRALVGGRFSLKLLLDTKEVS